MHNATVQRLIPCVLIATAGLALARSAAAADVFVCEGHCRFATIQSGIDAAHSGDTVHVAAGTYFENVVIRNKGLTLLGDDEVSTVIDGQFRAPVITLGAIGDNPTKTVTIRGFTITHGSGDEGGGIFVLGAVLDLQFSTVIANKASQNGGGIALEIPGAPVSKISHSVIAKNSAAGFGGGIRVGAEVVAQITDSTIARNSAGLRGGALHGEGASNTTITGTTLSDNSSQQDGGGIYVEGGEPKASLSLSTSAVVENTAARNGGGILRIGGLTLTNDVLGLNRPTDCAEGGGGACP
jgi:hypothetical protein